MWTRNPLVPGRRLNDDHTRWTCRELLKNARSLTSFCGSSYKLQSLEDKDRKHAHQMDSLNREQRYLLRRLDQLRNSVPMNKHRSLSECSVSTVSSTNSTTGSPSSLCEYRPLMMIMSRSAWARLWLMDSFSLKGEEF